MEYCLKNDRLTVTVTEQGAQVKSVIHQKDGVEHMWQADPAVWGYHAPVLFPYVGRLKDGILEAEGKTYAPGVQHGFARNHAHRLLRQEENEIVMELTENEKTLAVFPYRFRLLSSFSLEGETLCHTLTVENPGDTALRFGIGFHPAFAIPFDSDHRFTDYEIRFSAEESPLCIETAPKGLVNGKCYYLGANIRSVPVTEGMFDNDSHCMVNLTSDTMGLYEKDTGRGVVCSIKGFPYNLIWSKPGIPQFICLEPWHSLPSPEAGSHRWEEKPAAATLAPGESWSTTLRTTFLRP